MIVSQITEGGEKRQTREGSDSEVESSRVDYSGAGIQLNVVMSWSLRERERERRQETLEIEGVELSVAGGRERGGAAGLS